MKEIKKISALFFISLLFLLVSCEEGSNEIDGKKPADVKSIVITMIAKSSANPVFESAKIGAIKTAESLSEKYSKLDVTIDWQTPDNESASEQAEIIRKAVQNGSSAIIVSCSDIDTLTQAINYAVENGVAVMTFDSDAPNSKRFAFYGPDDLEMGKKLMNELGQLINGKGKIAILGGNKMANNLQERVKGIMTAVADYPDIEIVGTYYHSETEVDAIAVMSEVMKLNPDLKGWAMVGSWAFFGEKVNDVIEPGKIKIVAVDALPVQLKYIEKNYVQILLGQPTFTWGEISVETVINKIYFNKKVEEIIRLQIIPVTIENLGGWSRQLKAWGYKDVPEKYLGI
ncbi:MAG: substrate-binding domain-containing protein [Ignavibacteriaceae bacterium]|nr:substrate-binding domain-containing protein [Ignavibacteriaceae bacterium]